MDELSTNLFWNLSADELHRFVELRTAEFELRAQAHEKHLEACQILMNCGDRLLADLDKKIALKKQKEKA